MNKATLKRLLFTHDRSRLKVNAWNMAKAGELIDKLDFNIDLETYALRVISRGFFDLKELVEVLCSMLKENAKKEAQCYKIKDFIGTSLQEQVLKECFCYAKALEKLPKWTKELM